MSTIIQDIAKMSIQSPFFDSNSKLDLFSSSTSSVSLVYGENGSGKSSIAKGFRQYALGEIERDVKIDLYSTDNKLLKLSVEGRNELFFIFDEKFINDNILIKEDGLETIVLLGEQVEIEADIRQIEETLKILEPKIKSQKENLDKYNEKSEDISPEYWQSKITQILKEGGWAKKKSCINNSSQKAKVNEQVWRKIVNSPPTISKNDIDKDFDIKNELFIKTSEDSSVIEAVINPIQNVDSVIQQSKILLKKQIEKPVLTEREEKICDLFSLNDISDARAYISNTENEFCKTCFRPIDNEFRDIVKSEIAHILSEEIDQIKKDLKECILPQIDILIYQNIRLLDNNLSTELKNAISSVNECIVEHNNLLNEKIESPFEILEYSLALDEKSKNLDMLFEQIEKKRGEYNDSIQNRENLKKELLELNDMVAYYQIIDSYEKLKKCQVNKEKAKEEFDKLEKQEKELNSERTSLEGKKRDVTIAISEINTSLQYIFFSDKRLELVLEENQSYYLKSNGKFVSPQKISCGERNALALCYFFTQIGRNKSLGEMYSNEVFLVIDDPVSSFDFENKIGVLSFLRWKLGQILNGCSTSKVLLMSHDIRTIFDLEKAIIEIVGKNKKNSTKYTVYRLENQSTQELGNDRNIYSKLLKNIFQYANSDNQNTDANSGIGNMMRRVLEAFSTFSYRKGIVDVSCDEKILSVIESEQQREYFKNSMYRLVLNGESHYEEYIYSLDDMNFFDYLSETEKKKTAKDIICFMYLLNKRHICAHLDGNDNVETIIEQWCEDIDFL